MSGPDAPRRSRRQLLLRWGLPVLVLIVVGLLLALILPGGTDGSVPAADSEPTASEGLSPDGEPTATVPPSPATEQPAASVAAREGVPESARTVAVAAAAEFAGTAEWSDGASVRVTDARQQVTSGRGPGERAGQPQTVFALELTNGSGAPLDLNAVIVQAVYGGDKSQASPLYDAETVDFSRTLEPGGTATAIYSFAIPADQVGDVVLSVDVDGYRFPAVFSGAVPVR
ncbi:MAG: hypothetical protein JWQ37_4044 [Blastococcus sp.]|nr:hypothetical protein [Blastococcus sp.]